MKKIEKIIVRHIPDNDADLSWIGTFDSEAKDKFAVEHEPENHRTHNWFNPQKGAVTTKKQAQKDYERMMSYENGHWSMLGIKAEAIVYSSQDGKTWKIDTITSAGLWGIESDSEESYLKDEEKNQLDDLRITLREYGFADAEIDAAPVETDK